MATDHQSIWQLIDSLWQLTACLSTADHLSIWQLTTCLSDRLFISKLTAVYLTADRLSIYQLTAVYLTADRLSNNQLHRKLSIWPLSTRQLSNYHHSVCRLTTCVPGSWPPLSGVSGEVSVRLCPLLFHRLVLISRLAGSNCPPGDVRPHPPRQHSGATHFLEGISSGTFKRASLLESLYNCRLFIKYGIRPVKSGIFLALVNAAPSRILISSA